jgi:hypothetical protein
MTLKKTKIKHLQIEPDARYFNENFLKIQKFGFAIMLLLILAALLGLFGSGLFSYTIKTHGNLNIIYEKFIRQQASTVLNINVHSQCDKENIVSISKTFFKNVSIKSITPTPYKEVSTSNSIQYSFFCDNSINGLQIMLVIEPETFGLLQGSVEVNNNQIQLTQFVYP